MDVTLLFNPKPPQWGLRGDPYLWDELKEYFKTLEEEIDPLEFEKLLQAKFEELISTGAVPHGDDMLGITRYPTGGMSGGLISLAWWEDIGLPLLKERYQ